MTPREVEEALWYRGRDLGVEPYWQKMGAWWQKLIDLKGVATGDDQVLDEWIIALTEVLDESN